MFRLDADRPVEFCDGLRRRDFLHAGSLATLGLSLTNWFGLRALGATDGSRDVNCILLMLIGGPSQLDTFDMKPNAPVEIRGPYKPIKTNVAGIEISENFPRTAKHADKFSLVRSLYHTAAAVHDTGHQMMQTGRLFQGGIEHPHLGCVLSKLKGAKGDVPPHVLLPRPIGNTGGNMPHGQNASVPKWLAPTGWSPAGVALCVRANRDPGRAHGAHLRVALGPGGGDGPGRSGGAVEGAPPVLSRLLHGERDRVDDRRVQRHMSPVSDRSEEHTSELQSRLHLVC